MSMQLDPQSRALIDAAVLSGRVTRLGMHPVGDLPPRVIHDQIRHNRVRFHPETCGTGQRIDRALMLDEER